MTTDAAKEKKTRKPTQKLRIIKSVVDKIDAPGFYRDEQLTGFGLKVTDKGKKVYIAEAMVKGTRTPRRITIGEHGKFTPQQARDIAEQVLLKLAQGIDPVAEKQASQALQEAEDRKKSYTLQYLLDEYCSRRRNLKDSTRKDYRAVITRCFRDWLDTPITDITPIMVERRHEQLSNIQRADAKGKRAKWDGSYQADKAMRTLRALLGYAIEGIDDGSGNIVVLITQNPVKRLKQMKLWNATTRGESRRQTIINDADLPRWYQAVLRLDKDYARDYLLIQLFTGSRPEEIQGLLWKNVNFEEQAFVYKDTKNRKDHFMPMSFVVFDILRRRWKEREQCAEKSEFVFPSVGARRSASGHMKDIRKQTSKVTAETGIDFCRYDLKRVFITTAEALGLQDRDLKRLVNHSLGADVTMGYVVTTLNRMRSPLAEVTDRLCQKLGIKQDLMPSLDNVTHFTAAKEKRDQSEYTEALASHSAN